jgi:hypothetical protein
MPNHNALILLQSGQFKHCMGANHGMGFSIRANSKADIG